ncbi:MAG: V-type ATPase subunit [bacterium]
MRSLARYAVTNAVTRTMLSELLKPGDFEAIVRAGSIEEALTALARTSYGDYIPEDVKANELAIEKALREVTAHRFKRAIRHLTGSPAEVGKMLLSRWELDNLEFALRLWHGKDTSLDEYISYPSFVHDIPVYEITAAESIDEIALALRHTPYIEPVVSSSSAYKTRRSIFYVEVALEADYYARLLGAIAALGGADRADGERLIAAEIDLLNLSWLARLVQYYDMRDAEVHEFMIPGPSQISKRLSAPGHAGDALKDISSELLQGRTPGGGGPALSLERLSLLEHVVGEMSIATARALMAGYPFRITSTLAFYILIRIELKNLFTIFVGKTSGMNETEIMNRLFGLG